MGHSAHRAHAECRDQDTRLLGAGDDCRRVGCPLLHVEDHDVALHRREIEANPAQPDEPFRQEPRIGVILRESRQVVVERPEAGGG